LNGLRVEVDEVVPAKLANEHLITLYSMMIKVDKLVSASNPNFAFKPGKSYSVEQFVRRVNSLASIVELMRHQKVHRDTAIRAILLYQTENFMMAEGIQSLVESIVSDFKIDFVT
jgi:hypothetical protein